ncbi:MAG: alpha/beta hydrolase [Ginsengibacter sp.]
MMQRKTLLYNNKLISYRESGTGDVLVLVHGFGEDGTIWDDITGELEQFHLLIPDLPGSGESGLLDGEDFISTNTSGQAEVFPEIDDFARIIKYILDHESVDQCVLIGHSMGGYISLAFAERYPGSLAGLGLFHSSALADDPLKIETRMKAIEFMRANGAQAFLKTSIPNLFAETFKQNHADRIEDLVKKGNHFPVTALVQYYQTMIKRPDRTELLKTLKKPVLFIIGENDTAIPLQISLQQCYIPEISYVHILPGTGHMGMMESPVTATFLKTFAMQAMKLSNKT